MTDERRAALREELAEYAHEAWSGWMRYMLPILDAILTYPDSRPEEVYAHSCINRWTYQMNTPYAQLPEEMKPSDRAEADKMLAIIEAERT